MYSPENPSIDQQVEQFEKDRSLEEESALNGLLDELDSESRVLTDVEKIFLKRQLDRIDTELSKPHEDGTEHDDLNTKSDKIRKILEENK
jgi:hypothetical protein